MSRRNRIRACKRALGTVLTILGTAVWAISATPHFGPPDGRDVSIGHFEARSLGIIGGGASVAGGIILLVTAV